MVISGEMRVMLIFVRWVLECYGELANFADIVNANVCEKAADILPANLSPCAPVISTLASITAQPELVVAIEDICAFVVNDAASGEKAARVAEVVAEAKVDGFFGNENLPVDDIANFWRQIKKTNLGFVRCLLFGLGW